MSENQQIRDLETKVDTIRNSMIQVVSTVDQQIIDIKDFSKILGNSIKDVNGRFVVFKRRINERIDALERRINERIEALERRINAMSAEPAALAPDAEMVASTGVNSLKIKY